MIKIQSESEKRLIIQGLLNDKKVYMLIDTGASIGMFHKDAVKKYGLVMSGHSVNLVGAGGAFSAKVCNTPLMVSGKPLYQFVVSDIKDVVNSIERQTGIRIAGIIGLNQMKLLNMAIDTDDNFVEIG